MQTKNKRERENCFMIVALKMEYTYSQGKEAADGGKSLK